MILSPPVNTSVSTLWPTCSLVEVARAWALARTALSFLVPDGWDATKAFAKSTRATTDGRRVRMGLSVRDYYRKGSRFYDQTQEETWDDGLVAVS